MPESQVSPARPGLAETPPDGYVGADNKKAPYHVCPFRPSSRRFPQSSG